MIVAVDVQYTGEVAHAAALLFASWDAPTAYHERTVVCETLAPYEPGAFYKRELPCLLRVLDGLHFHTVIVDGYVDLGFERPGLGRRLADVLADTVRVVGVAKTPFRDAPAVEVRRRGARPLYATATSDVDRLDEQIQAMTGDYRIPTLLKRVDHLARQRVAPQGTAPQSSDAR